MDRLVARLALRVVRSSALSLAIGLGLVVGSQAANAPITCNIQTNTDNYLTAVGGGGRTTDVLHTDATRASSWAGSPIQKSRPSGSATSSRNIRPSGLPAASRTICPTVQASVIA